MAAAGSAPRTGKDWGEPIAPPKASANTQIWRAWWAKARPAILPLLVPSVAAKLPPADATRAVLVAQINDPCSVIRVGLKYELLTANAKAAQAPSGPAAVADKDASSAKSPPDKGPGPSSADATTTPACKYPGCTRKIPSTETDCLLCCKHCAEPDCDIPTHVASRSARAAVSSPQPSAPTLDGGTMARLLTMLSHSPAASAAAASAAPHSSTSADVGATTAAPPDSVSQGPLPSSQDLSITWYTVISQWKLFPFPADDHDRVLSALNHISAAWTQRATNVFHKYFVALGPADHTRRFQPKLPPLGISQADWDTDRSSAILAAHVTNQHLLTITRAYARSRFVGTGKKPVLFFAVTPKKMSHELYLIDQAQNALPSLDPANPTISSSFWSSPLKGFWWMLFASSLPIGQVRPALEEAVRDGGNWLRSTQPSLFTPEVTWENKYSEQALLRRQARGGADPPPPAKRQRTAPTSTHRTTNRDQASDRQDRKTATRPSFPSSGAGAVATSTSRQHQGGSSVDDTPDPTLGSAGASVDAPSNPPPPPTDGGKYWTKERRDFHKAKAKAARARISANGDKK